MSRNYKHLTEGDRHNFLIDKVDVCFFLYYPVSVQQLTGQVKASTHKIEGVKKKINIRPTRGGFNITSMYSFNINVALRKYFAEQFGIKRFNSVYSHSSNYIPSKLRIALKESGVSLSAAREVGYKLFFEEMDRVRNLIASTLQAEFDLGEHETERIQGMSFSLWHVEVDFDLSTPPNQNLASDENIRANFSKIASELSIYRYRNDLGQKELVESDANKIASIEMKDGDKSGICCEGFYQDGSRFKLYLKEIGRLASINRFERIFKKRDLMRWLKRRRTVVSLGDFRQKMAILGHVTFEGVYGVLSTESEYTDDGLKQIVKSYCQELYGPLWELAFQKLLISPKTIYTGNAGGCDRRLVAKTRQLAREGYFVRLKNGKPGRYVLNWEWIRKQRF